MRGVLRRLRDAFRRRAPTAEGLQRAMDERTDLELSTRGQRVPRSDYFEPRR